MFQVISLQTDFDKLNREGDSNIVNGIAKLSTTTVRFPQCTHCGHPRSQSAHIKIACKHRGTKSSRDCMRKPSIFKFTFSDCNEAHLASEFLDSLG